MDRLSAAEPLDTDALLHESQMLREDAGALLRDLRLLEQWQAYGHVELAGSYRWDLMLACDIDLYVVNPALDLDLALDAFNQFVRRGEFLRFGFIDSVRGKPGWADPQTYPVGYYLGMAREFRGRAWKVETFLLRSPAPFPEWIGERLTPESRGTILRLKHQRSSHSVSVSSYDIYRAVLLGEAGDLEEACEWLRQQEAGP